jgi:tetratricopeptide (TPR) repeat protein
VCTFRQICAASSVAIVLIGLFSSYRIWSVISGYKKAQVYVEVGNYEDTIRKYKRAVDINRSLKWFSWVKTANIDTIHAPIPKSLIDYNRTLDEVNNLFFKNGELVQTDVETITYVLGLAYEKLGSFYNAAKQYEDAAKLNPKNVYYHYRLGLAYKQTGDDSKAVKELKKAIELEPDFASAHFGLAQLYEGRGDTNLAIEEYKNTIKLSPMFQKGYENLSGLYNKLAMPNEAKQLGEVQRYYMEFPYWEFNLDDTEGWGAWNNDLVGLRVASGMLRMRAIGNDPFVGGPPNLRINASKAKTISIRMRVSQGWAGQVFWVTDEDRIWTESKSRFFTVIGDSEFHVYNINVGDNVEWRGTVSRLRLDPTISPADVEIDYIKMVEDRDSR